MDDSVLAKICLSKELWLVHGKINNEGSIKIKNKSWVEISLQTEFNFPRLPKIGQKYNLRFTSVWAETKDEQTATVCTSAVAMFVLDILHAWIM